MTEKELQILGFEKEIIIEYDGEKDSDYYYALDIVDGITFISQSKDNVKNNNWAVDFFNTQPLVRFYKMEEIQNLINILTKAIVTDEE